MTSPTVTDSPETPAPRTGPLRLELADQRSVLRSVDGAWWPHSDDVTAEVTQLVMGAEHLLGRIDRVALHRGEWADHPRRIALPDRVLRLGFFSSGENRVSLIRREGDDVVLLLIPPTAGAAEAAAAIARAVDNDDLGQAVDLLGRVDPTCRPIRSPRPAR